MVPDITSNQAKNSQVKGSVVGLFGKDDVSFYDGVEKIAGWLNPMTGHRTIDLLNWQVESGIEGNLFEIGVFCGKYFSLLVDSAAKNGDHVLGVDTFEFAPTARVNKELKALFNKDVTGSYTLWKRPSSALQQMPVRGKIGLPRFISIDGAHDYENVYRDLEFCDALVGSKGVIAVDDFLNPLTLGVNQAVNAFFARPRNVVPVAYISNKLFLAHASYQTEYRAAFEKFIVEGDDPQSEHFRKMVAKDRSHVEQPFFGHKVLLS